MLSRIFLLTMTNYRLSHLLHFIDTLQDIFDTYAAYFSYFAIISQCLHRQHSYQQPFRHTAFRQSASCLPISVSYRHSLPRCCHYTCSHSSTPQMIFSYLSFIISLQEVMIIERPYTLQKCRLLSKTSARRCITVYCHRALSISHTMPALFSS